MSENTEKLLLFLGGAALGSLAVLGLSKSNTANLRPALADLAAGALNLRDKAMGTLERAKEDASDFLAEVELARNAGEDEEKASPAAKDKP